MMKLYITDTSPYARMVRMMIIEKGLQARVEIIVTRTRMANNPYHAINPSGRVPYLLRDDGVGLEESRLICAYLDHLEGKPTFDLPLGDAAWEPRRLEAMACSMLDGLSVWARETARAQDERSPTVIQHERSRSARMADRWETQIDHAWMHGPLNMAQMTLACALGFAPRIPELVWRPGHPQLSAWFDKVAARRSFANTVALAEH